MSARLTFAVFGLLLSLLLAPLLSGVINRVKARMGGRQGRPLLQLYYDLFKLVQKSPVYPQTCTWIFQAGPIAALATALCALFLVPFGGFDAVFSFTGDFILLAGLFALGRLGLILSALDTGSAFEGMGAAREALFSAMGEPIFFLCMAVLAQVSDQMSLAGMLGSLSVQVWSARWPLFLLLVCAFFLLLLTENSRIPVDDPNTHLELTMIHEVMVLDHSGPELAFVEYAAALKMWIFGLLIAGVLLPVAFGPLFTHEGAIGQHGLIGLVFNGLGTLLLVLLIAVLVGLVESLMARMRMERVPQVLTLAASFAGLAALVLWR